MACYKSINSNNLSTIDDKYSEIQEFNSSQATNVMSFSFGFYQIYELNKELCAIGLSPMLRYGIMASATSCMSSILEGTLPVGKICAVVTGLGLLALFIFYWDEIQEKSDEILAAFKKVFYQVASMIETYYYNFLHFIETKKHVNSNGDEVERDLVEDEDELLEEANKAAGGDLDDCDFDGEDHWTTKDKQIKIEWAPGGHKNTNEGPHVTVYENVSSTKKPVWKVIRKICIQGWENYRKSYY